MTKLERNPFTIAPFCILHYDEPSTDTYYGFINYPTRIKNADGDIILKCLHSPPDYNKWRLYNTFYAFSPMIRPIPTGLKLINASKVGKNPWNTKDISYAYDPFDIQHDAVSFMTWTQPVPSTVPLYLHISPDGLSYPSFEEKPPSDTKGWTEDIMSPIYVLVNTPNRNFDANLIPLPQWKENKDGIPDFKFSGSDNRCIPDGNGVSIEKCFLLTDEDVLDQNQESGPTSVLTHITGYNQKKIVNTQNTNNFFNNIPPYVIVIYTILFILSLICCIILIGNK